MIYNAFLALLIFAGPLKAQEEAVVVNIPQPSLFPIGSVEKRTQVDQGFFDFVEDALGLKNFETTAKEAPVKSSEKDNADPQWFLDFFEQKTAVPSLPTQKGLIPQENSLSSSLAKNWWDRIMKEFEGIFNTSDFRSSIVNEPHQNIDESTFSTKDPKSLDVPETPLLNINIDPNNGIMFRSFAIVNIPPPSDLPTGSNSNNQTEILKNSAESSSEDENKDTGKEIIKVSIDDDDEKISTNHEQRLRERPIDKIDRIDQLLNQVLDLGFCQAKCVEQCITVSGKELDECKAICSTNSMQDLCAADDLPCLKACSTEPINRELNAPSIDKIDFLIDPVDGVQITWTPMADAVIYVVVFIADEKSVASGALQLTEDITNATSYKFKKPDACFQYKVKVAAIYRDGITPFSEPKFIESLVIHGEAFWMTLRRGEAKTTLLTSPINLVDAVDVEVIFDFSPTGKSIDLTKYQTINALRAFQCKSMSKTSMEIVNNNFDNGYIPINDVQFIYTNDKMIIRLPAEYATFGCSYEYTLMQMTTRCGNQVQFMEDINGVIGKKPTISTTFKLDCNDLPKYSECQSISGLPVNQIPPVLTPYCQPAGFDIQVMKTGENQYNATVSWLNLIPNAPQPALHIVRHGPAPRPFIRDPNQFGTYVDYEPQPLVTIRDESRAERLYFRLPRPMFANELHVFQVCSFWREDDTLMFDWPAAPRFIVDMTARPKNLDAEEKVSLDSESNLRPLVTFMDTSTTPHPILAGYKRVLDDYPELRKTDDIHKRKSPYMTEYFWLDYMPEPQLNLINVLIGSVGFFLFIWACFALLKKCCKKSHTKKYPMIFVGRADSMKKPIIAEA